MKTKRHMKRHITPTLAQRILSDRKEGCALKAMRVAKGIQLKFVASQLEISSAYLCDLESGNRHWNDERKQRYLSAIGA